MVKRRTVVTAATLGAAAAVLGVRSATAGSRTATIGGERAGAHGAAGTGVAQPPGPRSAEREVVGGRLRVVGTEFDLSHLALVWSAGACSLRVLQDDQWSDWTEVGGCGPGRDRDPSPSASALVVTPGVTGYEVAIDGGSSGRVVELNMLDVGRAAAAAVVDGMPLPDGTTCPVPYLSRSAWGANEALRFNAGGEIWPAEHHPVQTLTVHHTAGNNDDPNPTATVNGIYYSQTVTQGWGDIGYHLLIDEAGRVYQGRWSGGSAVPVFAGPVSGGASPTVVVAGHVLGFNPANIGVCLLGNFTSRTPTAAAIASLVQVLAHLARVTGRNPLGTTVYLNPDTGNSRLVNVIAGHRDYIATQCPGNAYYPQLAELREAVSSVAAPVPPPAETPRRDTPTAPDPTAPPPRRPGTAG